MNPWELETTLWKVWKVGREIRADWSLIHSWRTESKLLAKTMRYPELTLAHCSSIGGLFTLFPMRTWKTGPNFFAHFAVTVAC